MTDQPNPQQQIEKPPASAPPVSEPAFFVMPEEYRHGATGKKMAEPRKEAPKPAVSAAAPPPPPPRTAVGVVGPKKGIPTHIKIILVAGGILLLGLAVAGYLVLRSAQAPTVTTEERPSVTSRPAPAQPTAPEEPASVPTTPEEPSTTTESPFPTATTSGVDSDSDGLTDLEERLVYGTDVRLPDTDSDGFLDGNEVFHRYNPAGTAPGTLFESGLVKAFTGPASDAAWYRILYPSVWSASEIGTDWSAAETFTTTTGETVAVTILERTQGTEFADWVADRETGAFTDSTTKNGYASMTSEDQMTVYVDGSSMSAVGAGYAAMIEYDPGIKTTVDYLQTFKMMVNALEWL